jgi:hypothetical protein
LNPCFDDNYPRASEDVLLEGTREQGNGRGLLRIALDVITFVITSLFCCSTHFARNDIDSPSALQSPETQETQSRCNAPRTTQQRQIA